MNVKPKPDHYISPADGTTCTLDAKAETLVDATGNTFPLHTVTGTRRLNTARKSLKEFKKGDSV